MCNFTDLYKNHPEPLYWWLTGYPLMHLKTSTWIRRPEISIVLPNENISQAIIRAYGRYGGPFTNVSERNTMNDNGTTTLTLTYSLPWSISKGNVTVDVIVGSSYYKKVFLFDRHSAEFYTILAALLILTSIILLAFILHRLRYGTDIPYTRDIE